MYLQPRVYDHADGRWALCHRGSGEQVFNGPTVGDLSPVGEAPAAAVREAWLPRLSGQSVPMLGERVQ